MDMQYCPVKREKGKTYVSVARWTNFAELCEWFPGCNFSPTRTRHDTVEAAKKVGEAIVSRGRV